MSPKYFGIFCLFILHNAQGMEMVSSLEDENMYVMCMAPMMALVNKGHSKEDCETVVRQNWKENQSDREKFIDIFSNVPSTKSFGDDVVGNKFVAGMVPRMMDLDKNGFSRKDCEIVARILWQKNPAFRMEYRKYGPKQALVERLDNLPNHELNIIGSFIKRSGKDTLRCVNKALNAKIISQDKLYERYNKADDKAEINRLLCYETGRPNIKNELFEAIQCDNIPLIKHCLSLQKRYIEFHKVLYECVEVAMKKDNNADILKILIDSEKTFLKGYSSYEEKPLMLQAIEKENIPLMHVLFSRGVRINAVYEGSTLLQHAVCQGKIEAVKELITYPSLNIDEKDVWGRTALFLAAQTMKPFIQSHKIIQLLLNAGADPESNNGDSFFNHRSTVLEEAKRVVSRIISRWESSSSRHIMWNFEIRSALSAEKSDPELAECISLLEQAIDKKHWPTLGVHPMEIVGKGLGGLGVIMVFGIVASLFNK